MTDRILFLLKLIVERLIFNNADMDLRARHIIEQEIDSSAWGMT